MDNIVKIEDFKKELKRRERRQKVSKALNEAGSFVEEHKDQIALLAPVILGGSKMIGKISRHKKETKRIKEERRHRDFEIYDHSTGSYLQLRRKMTLEEKLELAQRCRQGEPKTTVLYDMNLLKR